MRRFFFISLRSVLLLLLLSTAFMWVRSRFKTEAFCLAKMGPNNAFRRWWIQLDSRRGRCLLQIGRGWPLMVPANLPIQALTPAIVQIPGSKEGQGARPTGDNKMNIQISIVAVFPQYPTGHWYPPGDPRVEWFNKLGMFGFNRVSDQSEASFEVYFPYGFMLLLLVASLISAEWRGRKSSTAISRRCSHCGYDLRATPLRCPECGTVPEN